MLSVLLSVVLSAAPAAAAPCDSIKPPPPVAAEADRPDDTEIKPPRR